jgi:hypothetical protein
MKRQLRGRDGGLVVEVGRDGAPHPASTGGGTIPRGGPCKPPSTRAVQRAAEEGLTGPGRLRGGTRPEGPGEVPGAGQPSGLRPPICFARGIRVKEWEAIRSDRKLPLLKPCRAERVRPGLDVSRPSRRWPALRQESSRSTRRSPAPGAYYLGRKALRMLEAPRPHGLLRRDRPNPATCFFYQMSRRLGSRSHRGYGFPTGDWARRRGSTCRGSAGGRSPRQHGSGARVRRGPESGHPGDTLKHGHRPGGICRRPRCRWRW